MPKTSIFQTILLFVFVIGMIVGIMIFSGILPGFKKNASQSRVSLTLWGTVDGNAIENLVNTFNGENDGVFKIQYIQKSKATIESELIQALARSQGPDLILFSDPMIVRYADLVEPLPYTSLSVRDFQNMFVDGANLFATSKGYLAVPLTVDPLVMYFNKDLYVKAQIANPPKNWTGFLVNNKGLTQVTDRGLVEQSGVAMGDFSNIKNAKEILLALFFQVGTAGVKRSGDAYQVDFVQEKDRSESSASALEFFTRFATPGRAEYAWNSSLPEAKPVFIQGKLANYFGFASEWTSLRQANPNLNIDVAGLPATGDNFAPITYGTFTGVAVLKSSLHKTAAFQALIAMTGRDFSAEFATDVNLPPARRDLLVRTVTDPYQDVFNRASFLAQSWYDPNPSASRSIFDQVVRAIISGVTTSGPAVGSMNSQLRNLF